MWDLSHYNRGMNVQADLLIEIEAFLAHLGGMAETTFGRLAVNDGKFVRRLREGCNMTLGTIQRTRQFMQDQRDAEATDADIGEQQAVMRDLIRSMIDKTGMDATGLARAAGLAPSTLSRFLYQPVKHLLTARTLAKLARISGVAVPAGIPFATPLERELLNAFRSTDEQGRDMILRLARSLRSDAPGERQAAE